MVINRDLIILTKRVCGEFKSMIVSLRCRTVNDCKNISEVVALKPTYPLSDPSLTYLPTLFFFGLTPRTISCELTSNFGLFVKYKLCLSVDFYGGVEE